MAGQWAKLPKAAIVERLTQSIVQMPLPEQALRDAGQTAKRLILLLPAQAVLPTGSGTIGFGLPGWLPAALAVGMLVLSIGVTVFTMRNPDVAAAALSEQPAFQPAAHVQ